MKHLSKALVAFSLLAVSSAAHAQVSLYGTDFDGSNTYPYTDNYAYPGDLSDLNGQGNGTSTWVATSLYADTVTDAGLTNVEGQIYSGNVSSFASHALNAPSFGGNYTFNTDFTLAPAGSANGNGNEYSFSLTGVTGTILTVDFVPVGLRLGKEAFQPMLYAGDPVGGTLLAAGTDGPVADITNVFHLSINVTPTGAITVSGTAVSGTGGSLTGTDMGLTDEVTGFAVTENDFAGSNNGADYIAFDNISFTVPEPSTYATMGLGLIGMLGMMKFRRAKA